jgi:ABC-type transport system substrate-binding protein
MLWHSARAVALAIALAMAAIVPLQAQDQKGTLVFAVESLGAQTLDPILEGWPGNAVYQAVMYDPLVGFNLEKGGVGPGVAERWELSADGLTWTFFIRPGQTFHNGDLRAADIVSAPINTMLEASNDPDVLANGYVTEVDYPKYGKRLKVHGTPWQFSETPAKPGIAPELGAHNQAVLGELGYSAAEVADLRARKII